MDRGINRFKQTDVVRAVKAATAAGMTVGGIKVVVRLGPQHVTAGRIKIERCHRSRDVDIRITPAPQAAIDAMPAVGIQTFLIGKRGKPLTVATLAKRFAEWATEAGLPHHCRLHGLEKGGMRRIAEKAQHPRAAIDQRAQDARDDPAHERG
jgi:hypothetical protein